MHFCRWSAVFQLQHDHANWVASWWFRQGWLWTCWIFFWPYRLDGSNLALSSPLLYRTALLLSGWPLPILSVFSPWPLSFRADFPWTFTLWKTSFSNSAFAVILLPTGADKWIELTFAVSVLQLDYSVLFFPQMGIYVMVCEYCSCRDLQKLWFWLSNYKVFP